jgi:hypothetical protein
MRYQEPVTGFFRLLQVNPCTLLQGIQINQPGKIHVAVPGDKKLILVPDKSNKVKFTGQGILEAEMGGGKTTIMFKVLVQGLLNTLDLLLLNLVLQDLGMKKEETTTREPEDEEKEDDPSSSGDWEQKPIQHAGHSPCLEQYG